MFEELNDMATDPRPDANDWRGDFESMRERSREAALAATPSQRLAWLEEAIAFAVKMGALPRRDQHTQR
jgi:hypothetical protein